MRPEGVAAPAAVVKFGITEVVVHRTVTGPEATVAAAHVLHVGLEHRRSTIVIMQLPVNNVVVRRVLVQINTG